LKNLACSFKPNRHQREPAIQVPENAVIGCGANSIPEMAKIRL
jgi:hypothetical protein